MRILKEIRVEGQTTEIHVELVSTELVNANEEPLKPTDPDFKKTVLKFHKALKAGAKVVVKPAKEYIQHF